MLLTTENIILIGALLLLVSVFAGKVAYRFGAPALLLFLGVGMLFGLRLISFNSAPVAQFVGMGGVVHHSFFRAVWTPVTAPFAP